MGAGFVSLSGADRYLSVFYQHLSGAADRSDRMPDGVFDFCLVCSRGRDRRNLE